MLKLTHLLVFIINSVTYFVINIYFLFLLIVKSLYTYSTGQYRNFLAKIYLLGKWDKWRKQMFPVSKKNLQSPRRKKWCHKNERLLVINCFYQNKKKTKRLKQLQRKFLKTSLSKKYTRSFSVKNWQKFWSLADKESSIFVEIKSFNRCFLSDFIHTLKSCSSRKTWISGGAVCYHRRNANTCTVRILRKY